MAKYRKKPVVIEAIQWLRDNEGKLAQWLKDENDVIITTKVKSDGYYIDRITIKTLEGEMEARYGDYIIKGVNGEFYPCKLDIFEKTYEEVKDGNNNN